MFAILTLLLTSGCRTYVYETYDPLTGEKRSVWINSFLSDANVGKLHVLVGTNKVILLEGYSQQVNTEAVKAISEGVTEAVLEAIRPKIVP